MRLLAIDPGETSAFITAEVPDGRVFRDGVTFGIQAWGTWSGMEDLANCLSYLLHTDLIIIEDYRVYPHMAQQHIGSQVYTAKEIGRIEWLAFQNDIGIVYQMASQAKGRWPNSRMRMYPKVAAFLEKIKGHSKRKHLLDAYRHLLTYIEINEGLAVLGEVEGIADA